MKIYYLRIKDKPNFVFSANCTQSLDPYLDNFFDPNTVVALQKMADTYNSWNNGVPWINCLEVDERRWACPLFYHKKDAFYKKIRTHLRRTYCSAKDKYKRSPEEYNAKYKGFMDIDDKKQWDNVQRLFWKSCGEKLELCECTMSANGIAVSNLIPFADSMPKNISLFKAVIKRDILSDPENQF